MSRPAPPRLPLSRCTLVCAGSTRSLVVAARCRAAAGCVGSHRAVGVPVTSAYPFRSVPLGKNFGIKFKGWGVLW